MSSPRFPRSFAQTDAGRIAWREHGDARQRAALFVHGVFLNGDLWNGVAERVSDLRRCIAPDLLAHGFSEEREGADVSFAGQADMLAQLLDALELERVDLVANDSGGGIAQILAARHPERIATLTLTNCDTHDGWPPPAFAPTVELARQGGMPALLRAFAADPEAARNAFSVGLEHPDKLADDQLRGFFEPLVRSPARVTAFERFFHAMDCAQTVAIEPGLRRLEAPALIVWGGADVFFERRWAYWLRDTLPNVRRLVELPTAKLFFPLDRAEDLAAELRAHWR